MEGKQKINGESSYGSVLMLEAVRSAFKDSKVAFSNPCDQPSSKLIDRTLRLPTFIFEYSSHLRLRKFGLDSLG